MKSLLSIQFLQILSFLTLLFFTFLLSSNPFAATLHRLPFSRAAFALLPLFYYFLITRWPHPVFLLNYACYKPPPHRKCSFLTAESFVRRSGRFSPEAIDFMCNICRKSGLGDETYAPPFIFEKEGVPLLRCAIQEAQEGIFSAIDAVLAKTLIHPLDIDIVIVTCGSFSPSPSLSSLIVNRYNLRTDVKTYNLSGMGCSSGVISLDLAARVLRGSRKVQNALVVITESITLNWYNGDSRPMLVTNCIFRVGCATAMITNDPRRRRVAKMELVDSLRTHHGADDGAYRAAFQEEDDKGNTGISLTKDLIRVAGVNLRQHIKILAPRVLPLSELVRYAYATAAAALSCGEPKKPPVPDFTTAFQHLCIHTGGKAVIENVGRVLKLSPAVTEPARMSLNRFGNTSSSLVLYELAYLEAKRRAKKGDKMWMLAFGTGFKVGSLVWKWLQDSTQELDNPWMDCIHNYPLEPC
ncbi:3-ketoacyl-CoA synthase 4 [Sesamum angolense]|uniref:3-ketoacyl-CoA synthase n=1 Tax=Sesamum angolense TaxID=2727404 RepID=A0AAE1T532_9LAMI|nr:3-ketoacyl-CoA synthase 4 [Sesamum angolense]